MKPMIYISIVLWKARPFIEECLNTLQNQTYPKDRYKIILSDNNSSDGTVEFVQKNYPGVEIIKNNENLGFAEGNNIVFRKAQKDKVPYVVLVNYDTKFPNAWLEELVDTAEKFTNSGAVQSKMLLHPETDKINSCGNHVHYLGFAFTGGYQSSVSECNCKNGEEITVPSGACVLYKMEVLNQTGFFDKKMGSYHEDTDLGWKIRLAGYKNILASNSIMFHKYDFSRSIKSYYLIERNRLLIFFSNYSVKTILLLLPMQFVMSVGLLLYALKNGAIKYQGKAFMELFSPKMWLHILKRRREIKSFRKVSDKELVSLFKSDILFQDVSNPLLDYVGNPLLRFYWKLVKPFI